jgi:hypothetical protein
MKHTINSKNLKNIFADFEVYADQNPSSPAVAILVEPTKGEKFLLPMDVDAARNLTTTLMRTLISLADLR